jgi:hypothetical protein
MKPKEPEESPTTRILSIEQAAEILPLSVSSLYREAPKPDSPFWKRAGRWMTTEPKLLEWVESGEKPQRDPISRDPMGPTRPGRRGSSFRDKVIPLEERKGPRDGRG